MSKVHIHLKLLLTSSLIVGSLGYSTSKNNNNKNINYSPIHTLLLCRHGDSIWNGGQPGTPETFTGWTDVPLSQKGIREASNTGKEVSSYSYGIDACFTSMLTRAKETAHRCMWAFSEQHHVTHPRQYVSDYRLNERHYGALQGYVKHEVENGLVKIRGYDDAFDPELVKQWRRNWHAIPPLLEDNDPRRIEEIRKYGYLCDGAENVPRGESLEMVANNRIRPFLDEILNPIMEEAAIRKKQEIIDNTGTDNTSSSSPSLIASDNDIIQGKETGGTGLVIAHANSLRALIGVICQVEKDESALRKLEAMKIQTGVPLVMKYQKSKDGDYQACDITSLNDEEQNQKILKPDLPVWPLSSIPKKIADTQHNYESQPRASNGGRTPIRIDVI